MTSLGTPQENIWKDFGFVRWHRLIWIHGGDWGRFFIALIVFTYAFVVLAFAWMSVALWTSSYPLEALISYALAVGSFGAYVEAFTIGLLNADFLAESSRLRLFRSRETLIVEFARFLQAHGEKGRIRGATRWASAYWLVYYGMMGASVVFTLVFLPVFGLWTPLAFAAVDGPIALACFIAYHKHMLKIQKHADSLGFRLSELAAGGATQHAGY